MLRAVTAPLPPLRDLARITVVALLLFAVLIAVAWWLRGELYAVAALVGLVFLVAAAWRVWVLPLGYVAALILLPYVGAHVTFPIYYHINTFLPVFVAMLILLFAHDTLNPNPELPRRYRPDYLGSIIAIFLGWAALTYARGIAIGNPWEFMLWEINYMAMFASYFYWRALFRRVGNLALWSWALLAFSVGAGLEFAAIIATHFTDIVSFVLFRILHRQPQITILAVPLSATFFLTRKSWKGRIAAIFAMLVIVLFVFVSQQRSMWLAAVITSFVFFTLYIFRDRFTLKKIILWCSLILLIAGFFVGFLFLAAWFLNADLSLLLTRWEDVENLQDDSFRIRVYDLQRAIQEVGGNWLLGMGGGEQSTFVHTGKQFYYFDISYGMAYFKGGLPMLLLMVAVYFGTIVKHFQLFLKARDKQTQLLAIAFTATMCGVMFAGGFNTGLLYYRFVLVWMMIAAISTVYLEQAIANSEVEAKPGTAS